MRIRSHARPARTRSIAGVEAQVVERPIDGESFIVRAVFSLPSGGTGVVERVAEGEWTAATAEYELPGAFESLFDAVEAVCATGGAS